MREVFVCGCAHPTIKPLLKQSETPTRSLRIVGRFNSVFLCVVRKYKLLVNGICIKFDVYSDTVWRAGALWMDVGPVACEILQAVFY